MQRNLIYINNPPQKIEGGFTLFYIIKTIFYD